MNIVNQHEALLADIDGTALAAGQVALWWMGQHSFILKIGQTVVYIDPFLRPMKGRRVPPLLSPSSITHATIIAGTHDHIDHIDRQVWPDLAAASPSAIFVVPELLRDKLSADLGIPLDRIHGLDDGVSLELDGVRLSAVPAAHEFLDRDPVSGRYPYLGYIIQSDGPTIYHAGDTCLYQGMFERLGLYNPEVMLLPINGRDAKRLSSGIIGNMTYQEAADLAGALKARWVVPTHWDMFEGNSADPQAFADYVSLKYPATTPKVMNYGQRWIIGSGQTQVGVR